MATQNRVELTGGNPDRRHILVLGGSANLRHFCLPTNIFSLQMAEAFAVFRRWSSSIGYSAELKSTSSFIGGAMVPHP